MGLISDRYTRRRVGPIGELKNHVFRRTGGSPPIVQGGNKYDVENDYIAGSPSGWKMEISPTIYIISV